MKHRLLYISLMLLPLCGYGALIPGKQSFTVMSRTFDVITPTDYDATKTYPVVLMLHPFAGNKEQMQDATLVTEQQYIGVYPEGSTTPLGSAWNTWQETAAVLSVDDVAYLTAVLSKVQTEVGAAYDVNKVYAYGFSNGGAMAMKMVKESTLLKGIAVRGMSLIQGEQIASTAAKVPMIFVHGTSDATVPYTGGTGNKPFSPSFEDVKTAVQKWAVHNGCDAVPQDIKVLASGNIREFWLREYRDNSGGNPVYFYALEGSPHATDGGFGNRNIKRTALRMFKNPRCYGLNRGSQACN